MNSREQSAIRALLKDAEGKMAKLDGAPQEYAYYKGVKRTLDWVLEGCR